MYDRWFPEWLADTIESWSGRHRLQGIQKFANSRSFRQSKGTGKDSLEPKPSVQALHEVQLFLLHLSCFRPLRGLVAEKYLFVELLHRSASQYAAL
jgi:hypothetical protein